MAEMSEADFIALSPEQTELLLRARAAQTALLAAQTALQTAQTALLAEQNRARELDNVRYSNLRPFLYGCFAPPFNLCWVSHSEIMPRVRAECYYSSMVSDI